MASSLKMGANHHLIAPWWKVAEKESAPPLLTITHACTKVWLRLIFVQNVYCVCNFLETLNAFTCCWLDGKQCEARHVPPVKQSHISEWI